jgi:hypothetical protein
LETTAIGESLIFIIPQRFSETSHFIFIFSFFSFDFF